MEFVQECSIRIEKFRVGPFRGDAAGFVLPMKAVAVFAGELSDAHEVSCTLFRCESSRHEAPNAGGVN